MLVAVFSGPCVSEALLPPLLPQARFHATLLSSFTYALYYVDLEPGQIARTSPPVTPSAPLSSSPEVVPQGPSKKATYVPLPDIEIHKAAPSSFMTPPMEFASAPPSEASEDVLDDSHKTPNVYINGLPPNFPEDQLFELAVPFGEVKSVRSFTRHVGEKESGYGFVLYAYIHLFLPILTHAVFLRFETIESAEKCIQSLRRFRNLHPTFSKVRLSHVEPTSIAKISDTAGPQDPRNKFRAVLLGLKSLWLLVRSSEQSE